jgi:hypothetical protein
MKKLLYSLMAALGFCLTAGHLQAAQTNVVQYVNLRGILFYQGGAVTNASGSTVTRSIIRTPFNNAVLITRFGQVAAVTFSRAAKLRLISSLDGDVVKVVVQDGTNRLDVSSYFEVDFDNNPMVEVSSQGIATGTFSATRYQLMRVKLRDVGDFGSLGLHFDVDGMATVKRKALFVGNVARVVDRPSGKLAGDGKSASAAVDTDFLAQITFSVTGGSVEVVP